MNDNHTLPAAALKLASRMNLAVLLTDCTTVLYNATQVPSQRTAKSPDAAHRCRSVVISLFDICSFKSMSGPALDKKACYRCRAHLFLSPTGSPEGLEPRVDARAHHLDELVDIVENALRGSKEVVLRREGRGLPDSETRACPHTSGAARRRMRGGPRPVSLGSRHQDIDRVCVVARARLVRVHTAEG